MGKNAGKKGICLFLVLAGIALSICYLPALGSENVQAEGNMEKYINVVYDDSGSMIVDSAEDGTFYDKWCQAKYAMEVFSTMLQEGDTMNIFPMSAEGEKTLTLTGSQDPEKRASEIHNMITDAGETPYSTVTGAYNDLSRQPEGSEKWLFIITDGLFNDGAITDETIKNDFDNFTAEGIHVIYLGIGPDVTEFDSDEDNGLYCRYAKESTDILSCMTEISNLIGGRLQLDGAYISAEGNTLVLDIDVPMKQIIIFAQGKDIQVGDMENADSEVKKDSEINVEYCDTVNPNYQQFGDKIKVAEDLSGVVATFVSEDGQAPLGAGTYKVELSDLSNVEVYYEAQVEAGIVFLKDGEDVSGEGYVEPGPLEIKPVIKDPVTHTVIESGLMKDIHVTFEVSNGGKIQALESDGQSVTIDAEEGKLEVSETIEIPIDYRVTGSAAIDVAEPLPPLEIGDLELVDADGGVFYKEELIEEPGYALATVKQEGKKLSEELWKSTDLSIESDSECISVEAERGEQVSTYKIKISYDKDSDPTPLKDEIANCTLNASLEYEGMQAKSNRAEAEIEVAALPLSYYWKYFLALTVILIIIIGYIVKRRFPRKIKKTIHITAKPAMGFGKPQDFNGLFKKKAYSVFLPFISERAAVRYVPDGVPAVKLQVRAKNKGHMILLNAEAVRNSNIQLDGDKISEGERKRIVSTHVTVITTVDGKRYTCKMQ